MSGSVSGIPVDAARDGSGVLVLARGTGLTVERVAGGRAGAGQVITRSRRVRQARIVTSPRGSAVVVWSINGEILSSRRPTRAARFGPARVVSRHPGAAAGLRVLDPRPDGIPAVVCLVAARATPVSTARRELGCQPSGFGVGVPQLLARTAGGGSILTWSATGDPGLAAVTFARLPGSDDWSPGTLAVAGSRGGVQIEALQTVEGGRAALVTQVVDPVFPRDLARVRRRAAAGRRRGRRPHRRAADAGRRDPIGRHVPDRRVGATPGRRGLATPDRAPALPAEPAGTLRRGRPQPA